MINTIRWPADDRLHFLGRNGIGKCTGLEIFQHEDVVELQPITSKDRTGRCRLCIPTAAIPQLISVLSAMRRLARTQKSESTAGRIVSVLQFVLEDWQRPRRRRIPMRVETDAKRMEVFCAGYGTAAAATGYGAPILLEVHNGSLRLVVWADIAKEDPTHLIDLEGARER